nr:hypothetical protein StreXyl84_66900 [Streptomyces sp. Xyl84]
MNRHKADRASGIQWWSRAGPAPAFSAHCAPSGCCGVPAAGEIAVRAGPTLGRLADMTEKITRINPEQLHQTPGYHHITVVEAGRTAYLAGQCPLDRNGDLVGAGSLETQVDQVVANALTALAAANAQPHHVVRSVIYVRSDERDALGAAWRRLTESALGPAFTTASTLLGVAQLGFSGQLVEVDLTVALPD